MDTSPLHVRRTAVWTLFVLLGALAGLLGGPGSAWGGDLWVSDSPPDRDWAKLTRRAHGGPVERGRRGVYLKRLWLREGDGSIASGYAAAQSGGEWTVVAPDGVPLAPKPFFSGTGHGVTFEMGQEGFYNAFLVSESVSEDLLEVAVSKAEVLKHSCGEGHDRAATMELMPPRLEGIAPLDIVRERSPGEDFHSHLATGDRVGFRVFFEGEPLPGAPVRMTTDRGWSRTVTSDADGRAEFQLIREDFPDWSEFDRRKSGGFLVTAEYRRPRSGEHDGRPYRQVRYVTTLPGSFHPAEREYMSYVYGLLIALFAAALAVAGVYHYRTRRARPPREHFDAG